MSLHYKDQFDMLFKEIIPVYSENNFKPINTLCVQNEELLEVKAGDTHHCLGLSENLPRYIAQYNSVGLHRVLTFLYSTVNYSFVPSVFGVT
jgi:hypothetical protein